MFALPCLSAGSPEEKTSFSALLTNTKGETQTVTGFRAWYIAEGDWFDSPPQKNAPTLDFSVTILSEPNKEEKVSIAFSRIRLVTYDWKQDSKFDRDLKQLVVETTDGSAIKLTPELLEELDRFGTVKRRHRIGSFYFASGEVSGISMGRTVSRKMKLNGFHGDIISVSGKTQPFHIVLTQVQKIQLIPSTNSASGKP
jgi:hypothetical protein